MPKSKVGRKALTVLLTDEEYGQIKLLASKKHASMSEVGRGFLKKGLSGELTQDNIEFLAPIVKEQLQSILQPEMKRMISLTAKTCIQAGTATYLTADAILKFVPPVQRTEVQESYTAARKKAVAFMKTHLDEDKE